VGWSAWLLSDRLWAVTPVGESGLFTLAVTVVLWLLPLITLRPHRRELIQVGFQPSAILLPMAMAAAVPLVIYAVHQGAQAADPNGLTSPYVMTGLGVVLAVQGVFSALRPAGNRWLAPLVAAAAWAGLAAIAWPLDAGSFGTAWGAALIAWAALFAVANHLEGRRNAPSVRRFPHSATPENTRGR
jgi:hypothetical protein